MTTSAPCQPGNKTCAAAFVNLILYDPHVPDPAGIINQGHGNATARSVQLHEGQVVDRAAIKALVRAIADRNRAGGWRQLSD